MKYKMLYLRVCMLVAAGALGFIFISPAEAHSPSPRTDPVDFACLARRMDYSSEQCPLRGPGEDLLRRVNFESLLPTIDVDPSFSYFPFGYLRAKRGGTSLYPTLEAAQDDGRISDRIGPGFVFLSYIDNWTSQGDGSAYQSQRGFVRRGDVSPVTPSYYQGLAFGRTPDRPFGWINSGGSCPQRKPGGEADYVDYCFMRYEVVQIYQEKVVDGDPWYLIGPDEWLQGQFIAKVEPDPERPEGVQGDRWISINLKEQTLAAYEDGQLVYATVSSTGRYGAWTQPGTFQVWAKLERDNMTGGEGDGFYYLEDVPWVLYFDQARALHGTYWHNQFGTPNSRGCVNLSITDARWFFEFAQEGTWVHVWDPSGETPTDPSFYGTGGA